jgi:two-component system nitrate/nitrite response regulator NarL
MSETVTVVVVDDHPLYRSGVVRTLEETGEFTVLAEGGSAMEAVRLCGEHNPRLVMLDISMPGNGIEAAREIAQRSPATSIMMLTASEDGESTMNALAAGARGYVVKGVGATELVSAARAIARGEAYVSPSLAASMLVSLGNPAKAAGGTAAFDTLTAREEQILKLVSVGLSNKEVGRKLSLQEKTVKHYMTTILQKLQVRNRVEASVKARDRWNRG